jgi:hypothetical protein
MKGLDEWGFNQHCLHFSWEFDGIGTLAYYFTSLAVCKVSSQFETHFTLFLPTPFDLCMHKVSKDTST